MREDRAVVTKAEGTKAEGEKASGTRAGVTQGQLPRIDVRFDPRTLTTELVSVISKKNERGPHGVAGLAFDSAGYVFLVSDRRLEQASDARLRAWFGRASDLLSKKPGVFSALTLNADGCCRDNIEGLAVGAEGTFWLSSDTGAVGKAKLELRPDGVPSALQVRCSPVVQGGGCDLDGNEGLEAIAVVAGKVLTVAEKPPGKDNEDKSLHPVLRVEFPRLLPIATLHVTPPTGERVLVRVTDAAGCADALWLLASYRARGAYHSLLLRVPHTGGELASEASSFALDNPPYGSEQLTPNLEAMAPVDDCTAMLLMNDDSSGNDVEYAATLLLRVALPSP